MRDVLILVGLIALTVIIGTLAVIGLLTIISEIVFHAI
jgi:hypothetical protein